MTDFLMLEELHKMIKEMPKPRLMFRKGVSVRGFFRPYMSLADYTKAALFKSLDEITPVTVRFSSMLGDAGAADTARNIKEMDVKFKTAEGDYDMLCQSLPVFFAGSAEGLLTFLQKFSGKQGFGRMERSVFWRFVLEHPETANCMLRLFSKEGLCASFIYTKWYSVNNMIWQNACGERFLVRYRWLPVLDEVQAFDGKDSCLTPNYAEFMAGYDPDTAAAGLCRRIETGEFPCYALHIQMASPQEEDCFHPTLLWDEEKHPYINVGIMKLTRICEDQRNECDLLGFAPGNTVEGIELHRDGFSEFMDYIYKVESLERGDAI